MMKDGSMVVEEYTHNALKRLARNGRPFLFSKTFKNNHK